MFTKTCTRCKKTIEYEVIEDLKPHFYFKSGYYRNVCKDCERKEHSEKYKEGKYNYRSNKNKDVGYQKEYQFGSF